MNKTLLIVKREYMRRVSKKSFLLLTFLTPFLFAALVFVPLWLASIKDGQIRTIAIVDATGRYAPLFTDTENFRFVEAAGTLDEYRKQSDKEIFAFLQITGDLLENPTAAALYSEKQVPGELSRLVDQVLSKQMEKEKMASFGIPNLPEIIRESQVDFHIRTIKWGEDGSENVSSTEVAAFTGMAFTLIIYMFILAYGAMVMQGVMEEKTNRIVEIMISSVRPFQLMMGKIIGIGLVGLTQAFLWAVMTLVLVVAGSMAFGFQGGLEGQALPTGMEGGQATGAAFLGNGEWVNILHTIDFAEIGFFFILYFIGGYLLYASLFAAIGSAVDSQEDTQQFMVPVTLLMVFALYAGIYSMENPDGPLAFWGSMVPFTAPVVMMVRLPFEIPLWQKLISIVTLYAFATGVVWFSAKIYRIGILMYGKKPNLKELFRWIRYK